MAEYLEITSADRAKLGEVLARVVKFIFVNNVTGLEEFAPEGGKLIDTHFQRVGVVGDITDPEKAVIRNQADKLFEAFPPNLLADGEITYLHAGAYFGDQSRALTFFAVCDAAGVGTLQTPENQIPDINQETAEQMAMNGLITLYLPWRDKSNVDEGT